MSPLSLRARRRVAFTLAVAIALPYPGCGMVLNGFTQDVTVACNVPQAAIKVDGVTVTPGPMVLERAPSHTVAAEYSGYYTASAAIRGKASTLALVLDVLWLAGFGAGLVFLIVDYATGAIYDLSPTTVTLTLTPITTAHQPVLPGTGAPAPVVVTPGPPPPPPGPGAQGAFCTHCGAPTTPGTRFCGSCGAPR